MKKAILFLTIILSFINSYAQHNPPQKIPAWYEFSGVTVDSVMKLPKIQPGSYYKDTAVIYYQKSDSNLYVWTGNIWKCLSCSVQGVIPNLKYMGNTHGAPHIPDTLAYSVYNVLDFGVRNDSTDCTSALQNLFNIAKPGSIIYFPPGKYLVSSQLQENTLFTIKGSGGPMRTNVTGSHLVTWNPGPTTIFFSSATDTCLKVNVDNPVIMDITFCQSSGVTPITSVGVAFSHGNDGRFYNGGYLNFNRGFDMENGFNWVAIGNAYYGSKDIDIVVRDTSLSDAGDQVFTGNYVYSGNYYMNYGFLYTGGGGMKCFANKFNTGTGPRYKYAFSAPISVPTVDNIFCLNSVENYDSCGYMCKPSVAFSNIVCNDNQFASGNSANLHAIIFDGTLNSASTGNISVTGNVFSSAGSDTAIWFNHCQNANIGTNSYAGYNTPNRRLIVSNVVSNQQIYVARFAGDNQLSGVNATFDPSLGNYPIYSLTGGADTIRFANGVKNDPFVLTAIQDAAGTSSLYCNGCGNLVTLTNPLQIGTEGAQQTLIYGYLRGEGLGPVITQIVYRGQKTISIPSSGSTINLSTNRVWIVNPSGSLAALTLNFPNGNVNSDFITVKFTQPITTLSYSGAANQSPIPTPVQYNGYTWYWDGTTNKWY